MEEKVYVTVGNDVQDGFKTLQWALGKFSSQPVGFVILHVQRDLHKDFVQGPFGKTPASSVGKEVLHTLQKNEQEKVDGLLSTYAALCGKNWLRYGCSLQVKAEIVKLEKYDEPIHKLIVDLISRLNITKLVISFSLMKSSASSWKSKGAISGSFYVYRNKPEHCQLHVVFGGKLMHLREENEEGIMEDDQGVMVAKLKEKSSLKVWFGKMFTESNSPEDKAQHASQNSESPESGNLWARHAQEIEDYFQELLHNYADDDNTGENGDVKGSPINLEIPELADSSESVAEKVELLKKKIKEACHTIQEKRKEAQADLERHAKAEWTIRLCNHRVDDLETCIKDEISSRVALQKDVEAEQERLSDLKCSLEESKSRLNTLRQLQFELSTKLQMLTSGKANAEVQLEQAVIRRAEMLREIEELRRERGILHRRIEFCKEKDVIGSVNGLTMWDGAYVKYTKEQIRLATNDFSENLRVKSGGDWTNVYKGRVSHATAVAVKILDFAHGSSLENLQTKVKFLSQIRHPHLASVIGFCPELRCVVLEYMHCGSLRDMLDSPDKKSLRCHRHLWWHNRIGVAHDICQGLVFLHSARPKPIIHGRLSTSKILLDRNLVAKISGFGISDECPNLFDLNLDVRAFGGILLELLMGRSQVGSVEEAVMGIVNREDLAKVLDGAAGQWPLHLSERLIAIAVRCLLVDEDSICDSDLATVLNELRGIRRATEEIVARGGSELAVGRAIDGDDTRDVPGLFICPIFQEVMKNPYVAADGFSYELEAIQEWLRTGHNTSPMTNLKLQHKHLTPNHTLRSFIEEWNSESCTVDTHN